MVTSTKKRISKTRSQKRCRTAVLEKFVSKNTFFKKTLSKKFPQWFPHNSRFCRNRAHHKKSAKKTVPKIHFLKNAFSAARKQKSPQMRASSTLFLPKCAVLLGAFWGLILFDVHPSANCRDKLAVCGRVSRIHNLATEQLV